METEGMEELLKKVENCKLNYTLNGIGAEQYTWLLAYYFLQDDISKARYLWKCIPKHVKQRNPEFEAIWNVGIRLWKKDMIGFYQAIGAYQWTTLISSMMDKIIKSVREKTIRRIGNTYSSVYTQDLATLLGLPVLEVERLVVPKTGWLLQDDGMIKIGCGDFGSVHYHLNAEEQADIKKIVYLLYTLLTLFVLVFLNVQFG